MSAEDRVREELQADRRLLILRLLKEYGDSLNTSALEKAVFEWGHAYVDRDMIIADVKRLKMDDLVRMEELRPNLYLVTLTNKGDQVQAGKRSVPGVARPS